MFPIYQLSNDEISAKYFNTITEMKSYMDGFYLTQNPHISITTKIKDLYNMTNYNELRSIDIEELVNSNWKGFSTFDKYFDKTFKKDIKLNKDDYIKFVTFVKKDVEELIKDVCW
jgi:hypothetical protein